MNLSWSMPRQFRRCIIVALALGCSAAAPLEHRLVSPHWIEQPSQDDVGKALAAQGRAYQAFMSVVTMSCTVASDGHLEACSVPETSTHDEALKQAALSLAPLFKTKPWDSVGEQVSGARVQIDLNFGEPPATRQAAPQLTNSEAAADIDCSIAATRRFGEDSETIEPATPPDHAAFQEADWATHRKILQASQQAHDQELYAFYEGRISMRDSGADFQSVIAAYRQRGNVEAVDNQAAFARCEDRMRTLRHLPPPPPQGQIP